MAKIWQIYGGSSQCSKYGKKIWQIYGKNMANIWRFAASRGRHIFAICLPYICNICVSVLESQPDNQYMTKIWQKYGKYMAPRRHIFVFFLYFSYFFHIFFIFFRIFFIFSVSRFSIKMLKNHPKTALFRERKYMTNIWRFRRVSREADANI